jgi:hydrogenase expression/formation protein HypC
MCLGIPGQIVEFLDEARHTAKVDVSGVRRNVNVALLAPEGITVGDWVLIHVGFAISQIDEEEARATYDLLQDIGDAYEQELEEFRSSAIE